MDRYVQIPDGSGWDVRECSDDGEPPDVYEGFLDAEDDDWELTFGLRVSGHRRSRGILRLHPLWVIPIPPAIGLAGAPWPLVGALEASILALALALTMRRSGRR